MSNSKKITIWFLIPVLACAVLFVLEQILKADYVTKSAAKLMLFLGIPLCSMLFTKSDAGKSRLKAKTKVNPFPQILPGFVIGLCVTGMIIAAYLLIRGNIDSAAIMAELNEKSGITKQTYLLTGLYISLGNSFLEEFFFRRFIFMNLFQSGLKYFAYLGSAILFSLYHLAIFQTWFPPLVMLLALIGLAAAALFLNYIVYRTNSLLSSWVIHLCANIAIIGIGFTWL